MKTLSYLLSAFVFLLVAIHAVQGRTRVTTTPKYASRSPVSALGSKSLLPPMPFTDGATCSSQYWQKPEYKCHWKVVSPETKVGLVFGPKAAKQYGSDTTLWTGLHGRGDPYWALLREATTALLNSYNYLGGYPYNSLEVVDRLNSALTPPTDKHSVLIAAFNFKKANSDNGHASSCKLTTC